MAILSLNFLVLEIIGYWRPPHWSSPLKTWIYNFYLFIACLTLYMVTLFALIEMIQSPGSVDDLIANSRVLLTMINACAKSVTFLTRRDEIIKVIDIISSSPCCSRNAAEDVIQERHNRRIRLKGLLYCGAIHVSVFAVVLQTAMESAPNRILPFKAWTPYEMNTEFRFWFTYIQQTYGTYLCALVSNCYDTIVQGCMMQTCCQLQIFKSRLGAFDENYHNNNDLSEKRNFNEDDETVRHMQLTSACVQHHLRILEFVETSNRIFTNTIFFQYAISFLVLCVSIYDLSTVPPLSGHFFEIMLYLATMMLQIYMFCYEGNDVTLEASNLGNDIYDVDWVSLKIPVQKSLLIIMTRTMRPLIYTSGHVIVLSLASFMSLVKTSYSAYNVLSQTS